MMCRKSKSSSWRRNPGRFLVFFFGQTSLFGATRLGVHAPDAVVWGPATTMFRKFVFLVLLSALLVVDSQGRAGEPVDAFLEALQEREHFELGLAYLDRMSESNLTTSAQKQEVDFRRGTLLVNWARTLRNTTLRQQRLDQAEQPLERFIQSYPEHPFVPAARSQLGNVGENEPAPSSPRAAT